MNDDYAKGFMDKCAAQGVDAEEFLKQSFPMAAAAKGGGALAGKLRALLASAGRGGKAVGQGLAEGGREFGGGAKAVGKNMFNSYSGNFNNMLDAGRAGNKQDVAKLLAKLTGQTALTATPAAAALRGVTARVGDFTGKDVGRG